MIQRNDSSCEDRNVGVVCEVSNCVYHDCKSACTADTIKVGPEHANSSADTVCSTFRPRSGK